MIDAIMIAILGLVGIYVIIELFCKTMEYILRSPMLCAHLWMDNDYCARCGYERPEEL